MTASRLVPLEQLVRIGPGNAPLSANELTESLVGNGEEATGDDPPESGGTDLAPTRPLRVVIAAAGKGTRFAGDEPKTVAMGRVGVPLIVRVLSAVVGLDARPVVVLNHRTGSHVTGAAREAGMEIEPVYQDETIPGMGGAILSALRSMGQLPADIITVWADMGMIWGPNIWLTAALHQHLRSAMSFPTKVRRDPYVAVVRDSAGHPSDFRFRRHGDAMPAEGESDCGVFAFDAQILADVLETAAAATRDPDKELDLLPVVRNLTATGHSRYAFHIASDSDSQGVNTQEELARADERYLRGLARTRQALQAAADAHDLGGVIARHGLPPTLRSTALERCHALGVDPAQLPAGVRDHLQPDRLTT